jgi:hypothetical protein
VVLLCNRARSGSSTTSSGFLRWSSSSWSSHALRSASSWFTSSSAAKTTTGGGGPCSRPDRLVFICFCMVFSTIQRRCEWALPILRCAALRCAALRCAALRCAALRCLALPCAALYCAFRWLTRRPRLRIQLDIMGFTSGLMYFGYMFLASYAFSVGTGTIGFISSFFFVRAIYGSIKVD